MDYNLLLVDLRDHGKSPSSATPDRYTFDLISADILEVLDHEKIEAAIFMSLSFGSVLLQALAMRRPELIKGAVLAGGIFKANLLIRSYVHFARFLNVFFTYPQMYRIFSKLLMPGKNHQRSRRIYQRQAKNLSEEAYLRWITLYDEFFRLLDQFYSQRINFPTLVVMGAQDHIFLSAAKNFVKDKGDHVVITILPGAGHICNIDQISLFNREVKDFLIKQQVTAS